METQTVVVVFEMLLRVATLAAIIMGLVGTVLQFLVYSRRKLLKLSFSLYFRVISVVDAFILLHFIRFYVRVQFNVNVTDKSDLVCKLVHYSIYVAGPISEWIMVAISIDRLVAVVFPRRFMFIYKRKWQILILLFIFALNSIYFSFMLWDMHLAAADAKNKHTKNETTFDKFTNHQVITTNNDNDTLTSTSAITNKQLLTISTKLRTTTTATTTTTITTQTTTSSAPPLVVYYCSSNDYELLYWLDLFAAAIVPFSFMIVIDALLIVSIFRSRQRIRSLVVTDMNRVSSRDRKFTITSISLNFVILVFNAPTTIYSMVHVGQDYAQLPTVRLMQNFFHFLFYSHYALGFYVQLAVNSIIRKEFWRMMHLEATSGVNSSSSNTTTDGLKSTNLSELKPATPSNTPMPLTGPIAAPAVA